MSDLMPMYARLRTTVTGAEPKPAVPCPHRRRDELTSETHRDDPNDPRLVIVTTEIRCGSCNQITGRAQRREVNR